MGSGDHPRAGFGVQPQAFPLSEAQKKCNRKGNRACKARPNFPWESEAESGFRLLFRICGFCSGDALRWAQRVDRGTHSPCPPSGLPHTPLSLGISLCLPVMMLSAALAKTRLKAPATLALLVFASFRAPMTGRSLNNQHDCVL